MGIPDTLASKEIRVYKSYQITTGTELFRFYKVDEKNWSAILYHFRNDLTTFDETVITPKSNFEYLWLQFYIINIKKLPSIREIDYKIQKPRVVFDEKYGYVVETTTLGVMDGIGYKLYYRNLKEINTIQFDNYEIYLKQSPDVDELNAYNEIINLIKANFNVWQ
ncbi:hypothetical protein GCM10008015_27570 [Flavobacterium palustre]|uniref:Uncharacterized protein n=1 Tax=Flavobacterium palustre TaxID=1476463 RepID=A0ABQ1HQN4_9FLAO|nr:hypothetical protein GCM10008015_27570 [Flavobacterium palustre]